MKDNTCAGFGQPPKKNSRQIAHDRTRTKVLEAARVSFEFVGYERTTIRDLAAQIGMSTGAIFSCFADKAAVYRAIYGHEPISPEVGRALHKALVALKEAFRAEPAMNQRRFDQLGIEVTTAIAKVR